MTGLGHPKSVPATNALPFAIKRANLASLKLLRGFTLPESLTPARFDLLYQLHVTRYRKPFQWRIAERLGVSRPTICKMIRALRNLGMLELHIDSKNTHMRRIVLTRFGRKSFARALKSIRRGRVDGAVRAVWRAANLPRAEITTAIDKMTFATLRYCRGLGDHTQHYLR